MPALGSLGFEAQDFVLRTSTGVGWVTLVEVRAERASKPVLPTVGLDLRGWRGRLACMDLAALVADSFGRLGEALAGMPDDAWSRPSLCEGWQVRHVVAHLTMAARYPA